jgi:anthranilate 1,2-dioxygenase large subunit
VPFWVYTDPDVYARELEVFFYGPSWNYVGLDCESRAGSFKRSLHRRAPGHRRAQQGRGHPRARRTAARIAASRVCWTNKGKVDSFTCPYHQWNFALDGKLQGVPLKRGALGKGGMPPDFDMTQHG